MDKTERSGIRICDLLDKEIFKNKLKEQVEKKNEIIEKIYGGEKFDFDKLYQENLEYIDEIKEYIDDTSVVLYNSIKEGKKVLFEGASRNIT